MSHDFNERQSWKTRLLVFFFFFVTVEVKSGTQRDVDGNMSESAQVYFIMMYDFLIICSMPGVRGCLWTDLLSFLIFVQRLVSSLLSTMRS